MGRDGLVTNNDDESIMHQAEMMQAWLIMFTGTWYRCREVGHLVCNYRRSVNLPKCSTKETATTIGGQMKTLGHNRATTPKRSHWEAPDMKVCHQKAYKCNQKYSGWPGDQSIKGGQQQTRKRPTRCATETMQATRWTAGTAKPTCWGGVMRLQAAGGRGQCNGSRHEWEHWGGQKNCKCLVF